MSLRRCLISIRTRNCTICTRALSTRSTGNAKRPTAGIIVIGDEILKAQVKDTNSYYMCSRLYKCGIQVKKISVISDNVEEISKEIKDASSKFTYVITSGGIGPTHDDVTYEALAKAFDDTLHYHPKLVDIIRHQFGVQDATSPAFKMACIPRNASLKFGARTSTGRPNAYPCISLKNVFVFPGSPTFFERSFQSLYEELLSAVDKRFVKDEVFLNAKEETFADALSMVVKEFPNVSFGSYPVNNCRYFKAFVTIESDNESDTERAKRRFYELSPANFFVNFDRTPHVDCVAKYDKFLQNCSRRSIYDQTLEELRQFYRNPELVAICINGSMESSIVIHLAHICKTQSCSNNKLQAVYFKEKRTSIDIEKFIEEMTDKYDLAMCAVEAAASDESARGLTSVRAHLRTLLVGGTGTGDGRNNAGNNCRANASNADELRVNNPLRNWTNEDAWSLASSLCLPYLSIA